MVEKAPRTSAGASGFGSHISNWLCPPPQKSTMTDFALAGFVGTNPWRFPVSPAMGIPRAMNNLRFSCCPAWNISMVSPSTSLPKLVFGVERIGKKPDRIFKKFDCCEVPSHDVFSRLGNQFLKGES